MLLHTDILRVDHRHSDRAAAYIPVEELADRVLELPRKGETILLLGEHAKAAGILRELGREVEYPADAPEAIPGARYRLWKPNEFLEKVAVGLAAGRALDLGCGSGRDAVHLASLGWRVTAIDRLPDALDLGRLLQSRYAPDAPPVKWVQADLRSEAVCDIDAYDLVYGFFFLDRPIISLLTEKMRKGAHLLRETFSYRHREVYGKPAPEHVLQDRELNILFSSFSEVPHFSEQRIDGRYTQRIWAVR